MSSSISSGTNAISQIQPALQNHIPEDDDDDQNTCILVITGIVIGIGWGIKQTYKILKFGVVGLAVTTRDLTLSGTSQAKKFLSAIKKGPPEGMEMTTDLVKSIYRTQISLGQSGSTQLRKCTVTIVRSVKDTVMIVGSFGHSIVHITKDLLYSGYHQTTKTYIHILQLFSQMAHMLNHGTIGLRSTSFDLILSGANQMIRSAVTASCFINDFCKPLNDFMVSSFQEYKQLQAQAFKQIPKTLFSSWNFLSNLSDMASSLAPPLKDLASTGIHQTKNTAITLSKYLYELGQPLFSLLPHIFCELSAILHSGLKQIEKTCFEIRKQGMQLLEPIQEITGLILQELLHGLSSVQHQLQKLQQSIPPAIASIIGFPLQILIHVIKTCKDLLKAGYRQAICFFQSAGKTMKEGLLPIADLLKSIGQELFVLGQSLCKQIERTLISTYKTIKEGLQPIDHLLSHILTSFYHLIASGAKQTYYAFHTFIDQFKQYLHPVGRFVGTFTSCAISLLSSGWKSTGKFFIQSAQTINAYCQPIVALIQGFGSFLYHAFSSLFGQIRKSAITTTQYTKNLISLLAPCFNELYSFFKILAKSGIHATKQCGKQCVQTVSKIVYPSIHLLQHLEREISQLNKSGFHQTIRSLHTIKNTFNNIVFPTENFITSLYLVAREGALSLSHQAIKLHNTLKEGFSANLEADIERDFRRKFNRAL